MTDTLLPVTPSIVLLAPSTRRAFAATFRAAADCFVEAGCLQRAQECEAEAERLETESSYGGEAPLAELIERIG